MSLYIILNLLFKKNRQLEIYVQEKGTKARIGISNLVLQVRGEYFGYLRKKTDDGSLTNMIGNKQYLTLISATESLTSHLNS